MSVGVYKCVDISLVFRAGYRISEDLTVKSMDGRVPTFTNLVFFISQLNACDVDTLH